MKAYRAKHKQTKHILGGNKTMTIYYVDELGVLSVDVDFNNIQFCDGEAYFSSNGEEYRVNIENIIEIVRN